MLYYKIPITDGNTDCSAGSILCCAYPQGDYMVCKFESVANVGSGWVQITAQEFEANCPDFPAVPPDDDGTGVLTDIDFTNFENGSFTETVDGEVVSHTVAFDTAGRPIAIDGVTITWGDA